MFDNNYQYKVRKNNSNGKKMLKRKSNIMSNEGRTVEERNTKRK